MDTEQCTPAPANFMNQEARDHIRAYLDNQRELDTQFYDHVRHQIDNARQGIGRLASGRSAKLTLEECADVACFIQCTKPDELLHPDSRRAADPYMGFFYLMVVVESSLRQGGRGRHAEHRSDFARQPRGRQPRLVVDNTIARKDDD